MANFKNEKGRPEILAALDRLLPPRLFCLIAKLWIEALHDRRSVLQDDPLNSRSTVIEHPKRAVVETKITRVAEVMRISQDIMVGDSIELSPEINYLKFAEFIATLNINKAKRQISRLKEWVVCFVVEPELAPISGEAPEKEPFKPPKAYQWVVQPLF